MDCQLHHKAALIQAHTQVLVQAHTEVLVQAHIQVLAQAHTEVLVQVHTRVQVQVQAQDHTEVLVQAHTEVLVQVHTRVQVLVLVLNYIAKLIIVTQFVTCKPGCFCGGRLTGFLGAGGGARCSSTFFSKPANLPLTPEETLRFYNRVSVV